MFMAYMGSLELPEIPWFSLHDYTGITQTYRSRNDSGITPCCRMFTPLRAAALPSPADCDIIGLFICQRTEPAAVCWIPRPLHGGGHSLIFRLGLFLIRPDNPISRDT